MIFSSMIPSSLIDADWSRLLGVGVSFIFIGTDPDPVILLGVSDGSDLVLNTKYLFSPRTFLYSYYKKLEYSKNILPIWNFSDNFDQLIFRKIYDRKNPFGFGSCLISVRLFTFYLYVV